MKTYQDFGIDLGGKTGVEVRALCPKCSPTRKSSREHCLAVNTVKETWICHHCDYRGCLKGGEEHAGRKIAYKPEWRQPPSLDTRLIDWFALRGIQQSVFEADVSLVDHYLAAEEAWVPCVAFLYRKRQGGEVVNIKYRGLKTKAFQQVSGAEKILWRQYAMTPACVVITEGEMDALSVMQAGIDSVVSVPDGAPAVTAKNYASKFTYLDQEVDPFEGVEKIVLAVDSDAPGQVLQRELSRRLGADRCWFVTWPEDCKDANDVLLKHGVTVLRSCIEAARPFPVQDVVTVADVSARVMDRYYHGVARGLSTGWAALDPFYTIQAGQFTIVTGIPGHGKSEWLDAMMLNMAELHGWRFAVCSPENAPVEQHVEKLLEKTLGAPFRVGPSSRMTPTDVELGLTWLDQYVTFIMPEDALTIQGVMDRATILVRRLGIRGLIIDPFNEFDHTRGRGQTETEYIGLTLLLLKKWAQKWQVHVWLVAHPAKMHKNLDGDYPVPTPYDINGSANFKNKGDCCVTVWRDENEPDALVQIHVQKIREKHIGRIGKIDLLWNRLTGRYTDATLGDGA